MACSSHHSSTSGMKRVSDAWSQAGDELCCVQIRSIGISSLLFFFNQSRTPFRLKRLLVRLELSRSGQYPASSLFFLSSSSFFFFIPNSVNTCSYDRLFSSLFGDQSVVLINSCDRLLAHRATVAPLHIQVSPYRSQSRQSIRLQACRTSIVYVSAVVRMGYAPQDWENAWVNFWYWEGCVGGWHQARLGGNGISQVK